MTPAPKTAPKTPKPAAVAPQKPPARSDLPADFAFAPAKEPAKAAGGQAEVDDNEPMLDLSTIAPTRPTVRIRLKGDVCECAHPYAAHHEPDSDTPVECCGECSGYVPSGALYDLRLLSDFGIAEQQELMRDGESYDGLWAKTPLTGGEKKKLEQTLNRMFDRVLDAPPRVKRLVNASQRSQIIQAFTIAPFARAAREARLAAEATETEQPEGEPSISES